jgi:hypothetical protein
MERKLACVDQKRSHATSATDIAHLLNAMQSPDDETRAWAVRQACPCRLPWADFDRVRKDAQRLQHDPSPLVRAAALHVAEDAREIAALEALRAWVAEHDEDRADAARRPRQRGRRRPRQTR